jgi:ketosteroid isomerase-like protein
MKGLLKTAAITLAASLAPAAPAAAQDADRAGREQQSNPNLEIVRAAFAAWAAGGTSFFDDVLSPDVRWTIRGSGPVARTYVGRESFVRESVTPLTKRLAGPIRPEVRHLLADGDLVVAVWDGSAAARDGQPYNNHFVWVFRMKDGKAIEVEAFLDLERYNEVLRRVPAAS